MDDHVPFWITTVASTPTSPTSTTTMTLRDASDAPSVPFDAVVRRPGSYPTNRTATIVRITAIAGNVVTAMTRDVGGMTAFPIAHGDEVYQSIDSLFGTTEYTARTAAQFEALWGADRRITVPPGLGGLQLTQELTVPNNIDVDIGDGSWLITAPNLRAFKTASVASSISAGTAFTGTVTEYASEGTLTSGSENLALYDIAAIVRSGVIWQVLKVRDVTGSLIKFYDGFGAPWTTAWKLHKVTPTCTNVRIKGLIKKGSGTAALARAVDIACGVNIDLSGLKTQGFSGHANDAGVVLTGCYNINITDSGDLDSGDANVSGWLVSQSARITVNNLQTDGQSAHFPINFAINTDLKIFGMWNGTGGRTLKLDTNYRVDVFATTGQGNAVATTVGILVHSTGGLGAPFAGAHYNFFGGGTHNVSEYGFGTAGNGTTDIKLFGGDYSGNNRGAASSDIFIGDGDGPVYLYGVKYGTKVVGTTVEFYEDGVRAYSVTPTVRQSAALNSVSATIARADKVANRMSFHYVLDVLDATGAVGANDIEIDLPTAAIASWHTRNAPIGSGYLYDASTAFYYPCIVVLSATSGRCKLLPSSVEGVAIAYLGSSLFNVALAVNDIIEIWGDYDTL